MKAVPVSWLDFKLGFRMLVKYPGLTAVGGLAMAFAICLGAGAFEFLNQVIRPDLPLEEGDRIVGIQLVDAERGRIERRALHDFVTWREELRTVKVLGAFRTVERNLAVEGGGVTPVRAAEITASAFRVAGLGPVLGRPLVEADERPGAPAVVVIGHEIWQRRFGGDSLVVGRHVRVGRTHATVVGVMPEGFAFPVSQSLWVPLRTNALDHGRREGPAIEVFGRLARHVTLDQAQAELTALGRRAAAAFPDTHEHLRPKVRPYAKTVLDVSGRDVLGLLSINAFLVMLLVLVCGNVALLAFARAASRESEIAVRNALGASRGRIIGQLFVEALVLAGLGALVGLLAARAGLRWMLGLVEAEILDGAPLPFWFDPGLAPTTVLYVVVLTVLAAAIAGVVPALKVTRGLRTRLQQATAGGGGFRFGGGWTAVIVSQVALTVAFPVTVFFTHRDLDQVRSLDVGFPATEYLSARLEMERESPYGVAAEAAESEFAARFGTTVREFERRLESENGVVGVTFADRLPRMYHPHRRIELDEGGAAPVDPRFGYRRVSSAAVTLDFFEVLHAPILAGRGFHSGDLRSEPGVVVVNRSFVERVLGGHNPIGRQLRYLDLAGEDEPDEPGPWHTIVGVVRDMGMADDWDPKAAGIYHPVAPGDAYPLYVAVHVRGEPESFAPRLRALASTVDPTLRLHEVVRLDAVANARVEFLQFWFWLTVVVSSVALVLSLAGIYSVMAFTVAQRTREIGVRIALGADPKRLLGAIFRRPLTQVALGIGAGGVLATALALSVYGGALSARQSALIVTYVVLMLAVCMLACVVPTRRALRVEPTEALRAD